MPSLRDVVKETPYLLEGRVLTDDEIDSMTKGYDEKVIIDDHVLRKMDMVGNLIREVSDLRETVELLICAMEQHVGVTLK